MFFFFFVFLISVIRVKVFLRKDLLQSKSNINFSCTGSGISMTVCSTVDIFSLGSTCGSLMASSASKSVSSAPYLSISRNYLLGLEYAPGSTQNLIQHYM